MNLDSIRADVAVLDELLREIAKRPVDVDDPEWQDKLRRAPVPVDEAGVAVEAAAALEALLNAYEMGGPLIREEVRSVFRDFPSFRWAAHLPAESESVTEFRRELMHVSAMDQGDDPRDELMRIWWLCNRARDRGIDVEPVLRRVADLSSDVDIYGFGSMRTLIVRGLEVHDLD
ncbi:hypothetical protein FHR83_003521 [Actinoplanes campanulatus]|uniref:Uncharacterized protein n=1 Tax=Actinoplanes campanulatus TaxID=113559 RepID=A0A7W5AGF3_9ACTN|nr:hypothetical protein [Actinoplanes campanulatus]MBB3095851.1 hypothetical protein [Actinoplanes campanulatus]GGN12012.1 hypothetical protein GCM10010109_22330 [Actinoplanes campanulatus]GID37055.1 hypothetical protein Aca09nite_35610 [Actinoplanes campanulatus]